MKLVRWSLVAFSLALSGCHGIEHLTAPTPAPTRSQTPVKMFVVMSPGELPVGGGSALLIVEATGADGLGVETPVTLNVSNGELGTSELRTDKTGHATGSWAGTQTATLTATAGDVIAVSSLKVNEATKLPPPSEPRPPTPQPTPEPLPIPDPAPRLSLTVSASPLQIIAGSAATLSTTVQNLSPGESVTAYQWDWDGNGTTEETTIDGSRAHVYMTDGVMAPIVKILTSGGHTASGTGQVIVSVAPPAPPAPTPPVLPPLLVSLSPSSATPAAGATVTFTATVTSSGTVPSGLTYEWDFQNDGTFDQATSVNSTSASFTAGSKTVKVRVTAPDGRTVSNTTTVIVG